MHILLFGKNGQVGWELQRALAPLGRITAVDFDSTDYCGDFSNPAGVADTVRLVKPDVIVNAAAHTAVDKAESEREFDNHVRLDKTYRVGHPCRVAEIATIIGGVKINGSDAA
jgi:dTDP-4-dehydrorhamnose reductase